MSKGWKPQMGRLDTVIRHKHRTETDVNGAPYVAWQDANPATYLCSFEPFHGSEAVRSGMVGIEDGGTVTLWYVPGFVRTDRILLNDDANQAYDVIEEIGGAHV